MWDPTVKAAADHLAELQSIEAGATAQRVAQRKLDEAIALIQTEQARGRSTKMKAATAEQNRRVKAAKAAEAKVRASDAPTVVLQFGRVKVTARPELPMDPAMRQMIHANVDHAQRIMGIEFSPLGAMKSPEFMAANLRDVFRYGIKAGAVTVEIV